MTLKDEKEILKRELSSIITRESIWADSSGEGYRFAIEPSLYSAKGLWYMSLLLLKEIEKPYRCDPSILLCGGMEESNSSFLSSSLMTVAQSLGYEVEFLSFMGGSGSSDPLEVYFPTGVFSNQSVALLTDVYKDYSEIEEQLAAARRANLQVTKLLAVVVDIDTDLLKEHAESLKKLGIDFSYIFRIEELCAYKEVGGYDKFHAPSKEEEEDSEEKEPEPDEEVEEDL